MQYEADLVETQTLSLVSDVIGQTSLRRARSMCCVGMVFPASAACARFV